MNVTDPKNDQIHELLLQINWYHDDGPPPTEAMFHPHQNGHHLHDHHQERRHVLKSVLAHQKDSHPHGSPFQKRLECLPDRH